MVWRIFLSSSTTSTRITDKACFHKGSARTAKNSQSNTVGLPKAEQISITYSEERASLDLAKNLDRNSGRLSNLVPQEYCTRNKATCERSRRSTRKVERPAAD